MTSNNIVKEEEEGLTVKFLVHVPEDYGINIQKSKLSGKMVKGQSTAQNREKSKRKLRAINKTLNLNPKVRKRKSDLLVEGDRENPKP